MWLSEYRLSLELIERFLEGGTFSRVNIVETLEGERHKVESGSGFLVFLRSRSVADWSAFGAIELAAGHTLQPSSVEGRYLLPRGLYLRFLFPPNHLQRMHFEIARIIVNVEFYYTDYDGLSRMDKVRPLNFNWKAPYNRYKK